jgi:hypothetical protein
VEELAEWIKPYWKEGGKILMCTDDGDVWAGGYVYNGKGKSKPLELRPVGKWS